MTGLLDYFQDDYTSTAILVLLALLLRVLTGLSSYSGTGDPPKYGDYEAQRHWMELTVNLPVREWYTDSPVNSPTYWPLDYPPLSGYQSWLCGLLLRAVEPAAVALGSSHGYETPGSKIAMRATVIAADLLVYIPACLAAVHVFYGPPTSSTSISPSSTAAAARRRARALALFALLFNPAAILIDHGHFQYNNISLGLALAAAAAIGARRRLLGSGLFVASLCHKQMSLFFAPAFFAHLLGWALTARSHRGAAAKLLAVAKLGITVLAAFALLWAPYLGSREDVLRVLSRIFPVRRGLYEDYVANVWCATSLLLKWKTAFAPQTMLRAAAAATLAAAAPAMAHQIGGGGGGGSGGEGGPSKWGLLRCMANSAFAFFMFSYQVHEKSILLPLLPVCLLAGAHPLVAAWLPLLAALSMFPLLQRDGLALPYAALTGLYGAVAAGAALEHARALQAEEDEAASGGGGAARRGGRGALASASRWALARWALLSGAALVGAVALHAARLLLPPPERLPWLHDRAFITFAFGGFAAAFAYLQVCQWRQGGGRGAGVAAGGARGHGKTD